MTVEEAGSSYVARADALKRQADTFLAEIGLYDVLSSFGEVELLGSYPLGVMNRKDIDVHVGMPEPGLTPVFRLIAELSPAGFTRFWVYDNLSKACSADPRHIVCESVFHFWDDAVPFEDQWTVSVSFSRPEEKAECFQVHRRVAAALDSDPSLRPIIIKLKFQLAERFGRRFPGKDVYQAVIERGYRTVADFGTSEQSA